MLAEITTLLLAIGLGVVLGLCFYTQLRLQRQAKSGDARSTPFRRITMAGLSFAMLFAGVLLGKGSALGHEGFMLAMFVSAALALIVRWRSNSTPHRTRA